VTSKRKFDHCQIVVVTLDKLYDILNLITPISMNDANA
jgi:hypothetical protein